MSPETAYGELGSTYHSVEDITWLRAIHNITIVVPADRMGTAAAMRCAPEVEGPVFILVSRMSVPEVYPAEYSFIPGKAITLRDGEDVTSIRNGTLLWRALGAAEQLQDQASSAQVIFHAHCETLDIEAVVRAARRRPASSP
jgi:transketolase